MSIKKKDNIENIANNNLEDTRKIKSILVIVTLLITAIIGVSYLKDNYLDNYFKKTGMMNGSEEIDSIESYEPIKNVNDDDDKDGVSNWREIVAGTDPNQNDGPQSFSDNELSEIVTATSNLTSLMARDLYSISKYKEKYPDMDVTTLSNSISENYANLILPTRLTDMDLTETESRQSIKTYANRMAKLFSVARDNKDFIELIEYQKGDIDFPRTKIYLSELITVCDSARNTNSIPKSYAELHADFVYNCEMYSGVLSGIVTSKTDRVRAMLSIKNHQPAVYAAINTFNDYAEKLNEDNIVFSLTDNGYIFMNNQN